MSETNISKGICIAKTYQNAFYLHKWIQQGGTFRFKNHPFAIELVGTGGPFCEVRLLAIPENTEFKAHLTPKKVVEKKTKQIHLQEEETIEM